MSFPLSPRDVYKISRLLILTHIDYLGTMQDALSGDLRVLHSLEKDKSVGGTLLGEESRREIPGE